MIVTTAHRGVFFGYATKTHGETIRLLIVAVGLPGGSLVALGVWLRRRWLAKEAAQIEALTSTPQYRYRFDGHDDMLRLQSERRRDHANDKKREAARIVSGHHVDERIRLVR